MKKYQIMINNIRFKIIDGKIPDFTRFLPENARLHNKTTRSRPSRGQMFEAEAKILASRPFWPGGLNVTVNNNTRIIVMVLSSCLSIVRVHPVHAINAA